MTLNPMSESKRTIKTARTNNDMGEDDSVEVNDDASLPKLLLNENASDEAADGADAGASAGAGYDIAGTVIGYQSQSQMLIYFNEDKNISLYDIQPKPQVHTIITMHMYGKIFQMQMMKWVESQAQPPLVMHTTTTLCHANDGVH